MSVSVIMPVLAPEVWQQNMSRIAIQQMRDCTSIPFELVMVEAAKERSPLADLADKYVCREFSKNPTSDINEGIDAASGDCLIYIGNDIMVTPGWIEAMLECFDRYKDCGAATVSCSEPAGMVGSVTPLDQIVEGMYGPITMFQRGWKYDEAFPTMRADDDLIMRIYEAGYRSYRNLRVVCHHLWAQTWNTCYSERDRGQFRADADLLFRKRYAKSPLWMAKMILNGGVMFGREHEVRP